MTWLQLCVCLGACFVSTDVSEARGQSRAKEERPVPEENWLLRTDCYGDPLPPGALARMGTVRFRHPRGVWSMAFSPDGKVLASGALGEMIRLWDVATGREIRRFLRAQNLFRPMSPEQRSFMRVPSLAISPDGKLLAAALDEKEIGLWELATGNALQTIPAHPEEISAIAFSPNGKLLATGSHKAAYLWDVATGRKRAEFSGHSMFVAVIAVTFSPDGKTLASGGWGGPHIWDVRTGKKINQFGNDRNRVNCIAFSPDGRMLACCSEDGWVQAWEAASGREKWKVDVPLHARSVAFSPDGKTLATPGENDAISIWDAATGQRVRRLTGHHRDINTIAFSPDGKVLASGSEDQTICLWDPASGREVRPIAAHEHWVMTAAFSPDGKRLATGSLDGTVRVWEADTGKPLARFTGHPQGVLSVNFSPDGRMIASAGFDRVILRAVQTSKELRQLTGHLRFVPSIAFSPDGTTLATGNTDHTVRLWDTASGRQLGRLDGHQEPVWSIAFAPDGKWLVSGSGDATIRLWDLTTRKQIRQFPGYEGSRHSTRNQIALSPDGKLLASEGGDRRIRVWELATGREIRRLQASGVSLAFSPDGRILASASDPISLWEVVTGQEISLFPGWKHSIWARAFDVQIAPLKVPHWSVRSVAFSPDGTKLASAHDDTTALVWDLTPWRVRLGQGAARSPLDLEAAWKILAGENASSAYEAFYRLAQVPERAVPFLADRLRPVPLFGPDERKRCAQLIGDLNSPPFRVRAKATQELEKLNELALPALRQALDSKPSAEPRRRIEHLLARLEGPAPPAEQLRELRALQVLERIGTPGARALLAELARGAPEAHLTREATASIGRLDKGRSAAPRTVR